MQKNAAGIVTYSPGPFAGMRAAMAIQVSEFFPMHFTAILLHDRKNYHQLIYFACRCSMSSSSSYTIDLSSLLPLKIMCHELGCLPVSKLCGLPSPSDLLEADGTPKDANHRLLVEQLPELLTQLEWMAVAMKNQRYVCH